MVKLICVFIQLKNYEMKVEVKEFPLIEKGDPVRPLEAMLPLPEKADVMICCVKAEGYMTTAGQGLASRRRG